MEEMKIVADSPELAGAAEGAGGGGAENLRGRFGGGRSGRGRRRCRFSWWLLNNGL